MASFVFIACQWQLYVCHCPSVWHAAGSYLLAHLETSIPLAVSQWAVDPPMTSGVRRNSVRVLEPVINMDAFR